MREIIRLGNAAGEVVGMDLLGSVVGSEGTFVIVTEITVRLLQKPRAVKTLLASFHSIEASSQTVSDVIAAGIVPSALEFVDAKTIEAVEASVYKAGIRSMLLPLCSSRSTVSKKASRKHPTPSSKFAAEIVLTTSEWRRMTTSVQGSGSDAKAHSARWAGSAPIWSRWMP